MDRVLTLLEEILSDICFCGIKNITSEALDKLRQTAAVCKELDMTNALTLCTRLAAALEQKDEASAAAALAAVDFYIVTAQNG